MKNGSRHRQRHASVESSEVIVSCTAGHRTPFGSAGFGPSAVRGSRQSTSGYREGRHQRRRHPVQGKERAKNNHITYVKRGELDQEASRRRSIR